jgi:DNA processing protein
MSEGPNDLIKRGAKIVCTYTDILEELFPQLLHDETKSSKEEKVQTKITVELGKEEKYVLSYLDLVQPKHLDDLIFEIDINVGELTQVLMSLEMKNVIKELPGNHYIRNI